MEVKPGGQTSECVLSVAVLAGALSAALLCPWDHLAGAGVAVAGLAAAAWVVGGYVHRRSLLKMAALEMDCRCYCAELQAGRRPPDDGDEPGPGEMGFAGIKSSNLTRTAGDGFSQADDDE